MNQITYKLNGTLLSFDQSTGALCSLLHPGCGEIVKNGRGLIDIAWPMKYDYEILRADPLGKHKPCPPRIISENQKITLTWDSLPMNTIIPESDELRGGIWAQIILKACDDGKSISLKCRVVNNSKTPVRQILFPDFSGLQPLAGRDTRFTGLAGYTRPFEELADEGDIKDQFFAQKPSLCGKMYPGGGYFSESLRVGRYYDYGGLNGGMSIYCRHWGWGPDNPDDMGRQDVAWVKLDNVTNTLRIANVHYITLEQGGAYDSPEYILTPHAGGWAQGIGPYKSWVDENKKRVVPVPRKVREALGFRTIWATEQYPDDPDAAIWSYTDYPKVAEDMVEHGLYKLNVWGMFEMLLPTIPDRFYKLQGGIEALKDSIAKMHEMGVEIEPMVSCISIWEKMRERYGLPANNGSAAGWSENLKGVPMFVTPYMERYCCAFMDNPEEYDLWIQDIKNSLRFFRDQMGIHDICWDQVFYNNKNTVYDIINEYRLETKELYPEASFSGESTFFFEGDIDQIDYTWVWIYRRGDMGQDTTPYSHVVGTTRPQMNIDSNPLYLKYCFIDNVMINVYPSKAESVNGSALIKEVPELSSALKKCAALRKTYMNYFLDGIQLGDCVLTSDCKGARVSAYALDDRLLVFAVKHGVEAAELNYDLTPYLGENSLTAIVRDEENNEIYKKTLPAKGVLQVAGGIGELFVIEFTKRK